MIFLSLKDQVVKQLKRLKMYRILNNLMITFGQDFLICCGHLNKENLDMQVCQSSSSTHPCPRPCNTPMDVASTRKSSSLPFLLGVAFDSPLFGFFFCFCFCFVCLFVCYFFFNFFSDMKRKEYIAPLDLNTHRYKRIGIHSL
jgi:hypothetical protein